MEMVKYILFFSIIALRLSYQPSPELQSQTAFASPVPQPAPPSVHIQLPAKLIQFKGRINDNKVVLNWEVEENETADQFMVEKSTDGVNYSVAGLIFGTDKPTSDKYEFYEKAGNQKMMYRIRIVEKDQKISYLPVVEINPGA